jgi:hypothetical protein
MAAVGGALVSAGGLLVFEGIGWLFVGVALATLVLGFRHAARSDRPLLVVTGLAGAVGVAAALLLGSLYVWNQPSCDRPGSISGSITYWNGASVGWTCVDGKPLIRWDTRGFHR